VTDKNDQILDFTEVKQTKNYLSIQLANIDNLSEGDLIKANLTPKMVNGSASGEIDTNGFKFTYEA